MYSLSYLYTREQYKKLVKRMSEDVSSIWYDHLEEVTQDYQDIKEIYNTIYAPVADNVYTSTMYREEQFKKIERMKEVGSQRDEINNTVYNGLKNAREKYGSILENPTSYQYFVKQRRNLDKWGRMMLLKPNRNFHDKEGWVYYEYYIHDFLNKLFAVSMLND